MKKNIIIDSCENVKALEEIRELLLSARIPFEGVENAKFHHNTLYSTAPEILKFGLLSYFEKLKLEKKEPDPKELYMRSDDCYVNGNNHISLAKEGITEADLYPGENLWIYHYDQTNMVDIVVSNEVKAAGIAINYLNEYLAEDKISTDMFKAVDIRLLDYPLEGNNVTLDDIISKFNALKDIAFAMKENNLDIPFRHNGTEQFGLDIEKVSSFPVVRIRR